MVQVTDETLIILNDITKLAINHFPKYEGADRFDLLDQLERHYAHGTLDWLYRKDELVAAVRYNILNSGRVADILDLIIKPGNNSRKIMKFFIARGWVMHPSLQFIRFDRTFKDSKGHRMYRMSRFFNGGNNNG